LRYASIPGDTAEDLIGGSMMRTASFLFPRLFLLTVLSSAVATSTPHAAAATESEGRIAFVRDYGSLHTAAPDGSDRRLVWRSPLGPHRGSVSRPSWSPNGRRIVFGFTRWWTGEHTILTILEDGSRLRHLTRGSDPSWAPDGDGIAFVRDGQIWTVRLDGTGERQLTSLPDGARVESPAWSPDRTTIVFAVGADLWGVDAAGGDAHLVLPNAGEPSFTPDGTGLLSVTQTTVTGCTSCECPGDDVVPTLQTSDADGANVSTLWIPAAHDGIIRASFSPDATRIAVEYRVQFGSSSCEDFFAPSSAVVNVDGTGFLPLGPTTYPFPELTHPDWSSG
jgi:dipeptidyl aminopeptidase/acylaminoacyl peptidase